MRRAKLAAPVVVAISVAWYLWWEATHLGVYAYNQAIYPLDPADEWRYSACSRLVTQGYALFSQVYSAQPPLLFLSLSAGMHILGTSLTSARWVEIVFGLVSLLAVAWVARLLAGGVAAAAAVLLLAVSPLFLAYSHTVEAEGPMMALVTLALACALQSLGGGRRAWAAGAGLMLAAGILVKLFAVEALAPAVWLLATDFDRKRDERMVRLSIFALALAVPLGAGFALFSPAQQWQQVVALHGRAAAATLPGLSSPISILREYLTVDLGLTFLACAGLFALTLRRRWLDAGFLVLWWLGTMLMLVLFRPLFPHHPAIMADALAVCAGVFVAACASMLGRHRLAALTGAAVIYLAFAPRLVHADRHLMLPAPAPATLPLSAWLRAHSAPNQMVAVDDLELALGADRSVPPPLCDPSNVRLHAGELSAGDAINAVRTYHAVAILPSLGTYQQIPGFLPWVRTHYRTVHAPGADAYLAP